MSELRSNWASRTSVVLTVAALSFLLLPIAITLYLSFGGARYLQFPIHRVTLDLYLRFFEEPNWQGPFVRSIMVGLEAAGLVVSVSVIAAYAVALIRPTVRAVILALLLLPFVLPMIVIAVGQEFLFSRLGLVDTPFGLALSHSAATMPPAFLLLYAVSARHGRRESDIAASLGSSRVFALVRIIIPLLKMAILSAFLVAFLTSFDEAVLSLFVGGPAMQTLPRRIFDGIRYDLDPVTTVAASLSFLGWLAFSIFVVFWLGGRRES